MSSARSALVACTVMLAVAGGGCGSEPELLIVGHRGAPTERLENSLASFERARDLGADGVELDVQRTADNRFVVMHDPTLERTTTCTGAVDARRLDELQRCTLRNGEPVRSLDEVLHEITPWFRIVFVDIKADKPGFEEPQADEAARAVGDLGFFEQVVITSSNVTIAKRLADHREAGIQGGSDAFTHSAIKQATRAGLDWVLMRLDAVESREGVIVRGLDKRLCVYSINSPSEFATATEAGIDVMMTDTVPLVAALAGRKRRTRP